MNVFMCWCDVSRVTVWYTVYSEDLEAFYCERFQVYHGAYPEPLGSFYLQRVAGGWQLPGEQGYLKQIAHQIEKRLEGDQELRVY